MGFDILWEEFSSRSFVDEDYRERSLERGVNAVEDVERQEASMMLVALIIRCTCRSSGARVNREVFMSSSGVRVYVLVRCTCK